MQKKVLIAEFLGTLLLVFLAVARLFLIPFLAATWAMLASLLFLALW